MSTLEVSARLLPCSAAHLLRQHGITRRQILLGAVGLDEVELTGPELLTAEDLDDRLLRIGKKVFRLVLT
jgi:hypothetical protein